MRVISRVTNIQIIVLLFLSQQVYSTIYYTGITGNNLSNNSLTKLKDVYNLNTESFIYNPSTNRILNSINYAIPIYRNGKISIHKSRCNTRCTEADFNSWKFSYPNCGNSRNLIIAKSDTSRFKFYYNYSDSVSVIPLIGIWKDVQDAVYNGSVTLKPHTGVVLINTNAFVTTNCSATGTITWEQWDNISGTNISDIPLQNKPSSTRLLSFFEGPSNMADNYGSRIRGYICPPQTGNYTFWVAGDDASELWLSADDNPANKVKIANIDGWTDYRDWNKYPSQKSATITLEAGKKYYIEALEKEADGGDNLSVQWQLPNGTTETPIAGSHLSPYVETPINTNCSATGTIFYEQWENISGTSISDIPLYKAPSVTKQLTALEGPFDTADNYGSRISGYICPPQTGSYIFWVAGDDATELWLSTDYNPINKVRIANIDSWTSYREWEKYPSQKSVAVTLQAGEKYYIEALQKEADGGDNLSVQWLLPDGTMETPIAGSHLSPYVDVTIAGTGSITRDEWDNVGGTNISDIPLQKTPTSTSQVTSFEGLLNTTDNYASRIRGYVYPPQTGNYTFWISTDDSGELWLSKDDNSANKTRIANVESWTDYKEWGKFPSQKSITITLQAGKKYYIEALQKEGGGGDNLSVQWQLPDGTIETPIAGSHLSPYREEQLQTFSLNSSFTNNTDSTFSITANESLSKIYKKIGLFIYPNPVSNQTTVEFTLADSGQTDIALYNTKGQFIQKLFTGTTEANITNNTVLSAETLKDGIYIINLISGKNRLTKKLIVIK